MIKKDVFADPSPSQCVVQKMKHGGGFRTALQTAKSQFNYFWRPTQDLSRSHPVAGTRRIVHFCEKTRRNVKQTDHLSGRARKQRLSQ